MLDGLRDCGSMILTNRIRSNYVFQLKPLDLTSAYAYVYVMLVNKAYRYEVDPTAGQLAKIKQSVGTARFAYNWGLAKRIDEYETTGKSSSAMDQHKELVTLKNSQFPWMREVSKCCVQEALRNLDTAYKNFFRRVKQGEKPGFPRFKKRGVSRDSCRFVGAIRVSHRKIQLPRLGKLRTKESTIKFTGRILNATLSREADRWYVSLSVEVELPNPSPVMGPVVGIDLGLNSFAVLSDGTRIKAPKPLQQTQELLAKRQRQHSKKKKGSNNRRKSGMRIARLHRRIRNVRKDFLHKLTTNLAKTKSVIVVEDLSVQNMMKNSKLARSISDAGWYEFRRQLGYKTKWYGSELVIAPRFYPSSKTCSKCGHVKANLSLSERTFICDACGFILDRDLNAARNLKSLSTGSSPGSNACGGSIRPKLKPQPTRQLPAKQESALSEMAKA